MKEIALLVEKALETTESKSVDYDDDEDTETEDRGRLADVCRESINAIKAKLSLLS